MSDPSITVNVPGEGSSQAADLAQAAAEAADAPKEPRTRQQALSEVLAALRLGGSASELDALEAFANDPGQ